MKKRLCLLLLLPLLLTGCRREEPARTGYELYFQEADLTFSAGDGAFRTETVYLYDERTETSQQLAEALMEALGLTPLAGRRADGLSGGETARMALARVLMRPCGLLILDEPTASMDMEAAILAERLVAAYREETGCAVLLITHDLQQARRMADEALFFCGGQLWESGPAERVLFAPERPETGKFLEFYGGERPSRG